MHKVSSTARARLRLPNPVHQLLHARPAAAPTFPYPTLSRRDIQRMVLENLG
jgi:hypothetical protein